MDIGETINGLFSQIGIGNAWCLILGIIGVGGIILLTRPAPKPEDPNTALGRAVRSAWRNLNKPPE